MRVGFLGCGNIANIVMELVQKSGLDCSVTAVFDIDSKKAESFRKRFDGSIKVAGDIDSLIDDVDLVIEVASQDAVRDYGLMILEEGRDLMVLSVGALSDDLFFKMLREAARDYGARIYIPSGAIVGVDGFKAGSLVNVDRILLVTTKPPESLGVDVEEKSVLYEGPAREGIGKFPQNVNVAATLGLAVGLDKTELKVVADPGVKENIHEIHVSGDFGEFHIRNVNRMSPHNPKTSYIAALSVVALLERILGVVEIGT